MFFPSNSTRLIQPLDLTVNHILKDELRKQWVEKHQETKAKISRSEILNRINYALNKITKDHIVSSFQKAGLILPRLEAMEIEM